MLKESDIVDTVCNLLSEKKFKIECRSNTNQHGYDIIASKENETNKIELYIEAKGETSSRKDSANYGHTFSNSQIRVI